MQDSVDVKALRARFNNKHSTSDTSSRDSGSPKSPRPGFGRAILPATESEVTNRLSPTPPPLSAGLVPPRHVGAHPGEISKVRQTGELLQNIMLRQQKPPPGPKPGPALARSPTATPLQPRPQPRQRSAGDVTPLRRPLPPERPLPLKPRRPPSVKLDQFLRSHQGSAHGSPRKSDAILSRPADTSPSPAAVLSPPKIPQRINKPKTLPHQVDPVDFEDEDDPYDDVASFEKSGSCSDNSSQYLERDESDELYEFIDKEPVEVNHVAVEKKNKKEAKRQQQQEKKEKVELKKRQNELRKNFQLQGEVEVLHTARVRHDWQGGGKLDLSVQQGESVEIIRVKNNPGGKWLARSLNGSYGYISNTCVDVDYEAIKRNVLQSKRPDTYQTRHDTYPLPPPPPDPTRLFQLEANKDSSIVDDDNYDDVHPITDDFPLPPPPPPLEIHIDPKVEKELRKKFKFEGHLTVLHSMMVDPSCVIKKPTGKDLQVTPGEIVDVIQLTDDKKVLCCNNRGKYGYVSRSYLLPMEGDIYDDVDHGLDVYDNEDPC